MTKNYNISKKSDLNKFAKELEKGVKDAAKNAIVEDGVEIACPHCDKKIQVVSGDNTCPHCENIVGISFDFSEL